MRTALRRLPGLSLTVRIGLLGSLLLLMATASVVFLLLSDARREMQAAAEVALDRSLKLLNTTLQDEGGAGTAFALREGRLHIGSHPIGAADVAVDRVRDIFGGTATVFLGDTRVATNVTKADGSRAIGTKLARGPVYDAVLGEGRTYRGEAEILGIPYITRYEPIRDASGATIGILYVGVKKAAYLSSLDDMSWRAGLVGLAVCGASVVLLCFALRRALIPLKLLTTATRRLSEGQLEQDVPARTNRDEIGAMARAVQVFKESLLHMRDLEATAAQARLATEAQRKAGMREMADSFEEAVGGIITAVSAAATAMRVTAEGMNATASRTATQSNSVAAATEEAAASVTTVAAAAEQLGQSVHEIDRQITGSARLTRSVVDAAAQSTLLVQDLAAVASGIGNVVGLISNVASQTDLLALNATIEAARAGAAGRGFAVVAAEVKALASQTAQATDTISGQIARIQTATEKAVTSISDITARIGEISDVSAAIEAAVGQQGAATQEIVRNVAQAAMGTTAVTHGIVGVATVAEEAGAAALHVLDAAGGLSRQSEHLEAEVARFMQRIRAA